MLTNFDKPQAAADLKKELVSNVHYQPPAVSLSNMDLKISGDTSWLKIIDHEVSFRAQKLLFYHT